MTVRLIKKGEQKSAKPSETNPLDEKEIRRLARKLAKAWNVGPGQRSRREGHRSKRSANLQVSSI